MREKRCGRFRIFVEILINILSIKNTQTTACRINVRNIVLIRFTPKNRIATCILYIRLIANRMALFVVVRSTIRTRVVTYDRHHSSYCQGICYFRLFSCVKIDEAEAMHPYLTHVQLHECIHVLRLPATSHKRAAVLQLVLHVARHAHSMQSE